MSHSRRRSALKSICKAGVNAQRSSGGPWWTLFSNGTTTSTPPGGNPEPISRRVSLIIHNPRVPSAGNERLNKTLRWNDSHSLVKGYIDDLREETDNCPRILALLVLPRQEGEWLNQTPEQLVLPRWMSWRSLVGEPAVKATRTVRISIPRANVFSVEALYRLLAEQQRKDDRP